MKKNEILFIDDEECIRQIATRMLEKDNFHVTTLDSGDGAVDAVSKKRPVLVFLDIKMPGRNGLEVLQELKAADPTLPVIMMSGYMNSRYAVEASKSGANDYILKPMDWGYLRNIAHLYAALTKETPEPEPVSRS
jgi:DNA-binding NtrC family response regulator